MMERDFYEVLGVKREATDAQIKAAWRARSKEAHPDAGGSAERQREVNEAYEVLRDPKRRTIYDELGANVDVEAEARWKLRDLFGALLDADTQLFDLRGVAEDSVARMLGGIREALRLAKDDLRHFERRAERMKARPGVEDLFAAVAETKLSAARRNVRLIGLDLAICERVGKILEAEYENVGVMALEGGGDPWDAPLSKTRVVGGNRGGRSFYRGGN